MSEPGIAEEAGEPRAEDMAPGPIVLRARRGLAVHSTVAGCVCLRIIALNVTRAPELIWWPFPVVGMLLGLGTHWWYGYGRLEEQLRQRPDRGNN